MPWLISVVLLLNFRIISSAPIATNFTTTIKILPGEVKEHLAYFANSKVSSPLKNLLDDPDKLYAFCKAAEFAAESYKGFQGGHSFLLRNILDLHEIGSSDYKARLLLQDQRTQILRDKEFHFGIRELTQGLYEAEVSYPRPKRSDDSEDNYENEHISKNETCDSLSKLANCTSCGYKGICRKGSARVSQWLDFALRTQRELQINTSFDKYQMLGAHNAFNDRADGYGEFDDCNWPPPYKGVCIDLANHEFSFTDLLNMGVRALEIDPWWCFGKIRMSHARDHAYFGCGPWDREFRSGIQEIADWVRKPENAQEIVRIYLEDGETHTKGHDLLINGPIKEYLGDIVLTPNDTQTYFKGRWPSIPEMRKLGKTVVIATGNSYNHQGAFIHKVYWHEMTYNKFLSFKNCSAVNDVMSVRVYSDSTEYGPFWNGPKETGTILDYMDFLKCGVIYPAADQVNPRLLETAVFTWAKGEPSNSITENSCVLLCGENGRWHVENCAEKHPFACVSGKDENAWVLSYGIGPYSEAVCPSGYIFSVPHNAKQNSKLLGVVKNRDVWLNFTPVIQLL